MPRPSQVAAFPWDALERVSRSTTAAIAQINAALPEAVGLDDLAFALADILGESVSIVFQRFCDAADACSADEALHFSCNDDSIGVSLALDPQLADAWLSRLLNQTPGIAGASPLSDAKVRGAVARIFVEACRRASTTLSVTPRLAAPSAAFGTLGVSVTLLYAGRSYDVSVSLSKLRPAALKLSPARLSELAGSMLTVPLFGAICSIERADFENLSVGDAVLPGTGWWLTPELQGTLSMLAEDASRGVFFEIVDARNVKLVDVQDVPMSEESAMPEPVDSELSERIADAVLDAPVVMRVEVASLSLSAEAFANLRPGDIVATQQPLGQLSTLRVAGREVAQGELVNIDGELGVRIRKLARRP